MEGIGHRKLRVGEDKEEAGNRTCNRVDTGVKGSCDVVEGLRPGRELEKEGRNFGTTI